jgi:hypothetical protein
MRILQIIKQVLLGIALALAVIYLLVTYGPGRTRQGPGQPAGTAVESLPAEDVPTGQ